MKKLLLPFCLSLFLFSCSLVKSPHSCKFQRVKYHAHLKKSKSKTQKIERNQSEKVAVNSFIEKPATEIKEQKSKKILSVTALQDIRSNSSNSLDKEVKALDPASLNRLNDLLQQMESAPVDAALAPLPVSHYWWDDDPEDWPWGEIALTLIAVLLIAIVIILLIEVLTALVASLLGLILLLALAYFLYHYWM